MTLNISKIGLFRGNLEFINVVKVLQVGARLKTLNPLLAIV